MGNYANILPYPQNLVVIDIYNYFAGRVMKCSQLNKDLASLVPTNLFFVYIGPCC